MSVDNSFLCCLVYSGPSREVGGGSAYSELLKFTSMSPST